MSEQPKTEPTPAQPERTWPVPNRANRRANGFIRNRGRGKHQRQQRKGQR